jgi:hypothetical protein
MKLALLFIGLSVGNFLYSFFVGGDYDVALERSFFQGVALLCVWLIL